jgi:aspartate/methionine/tyrosine aminotransferase
VTGTWGGARRDPVHPEGDKPLPHRTEKLTIYEWTGATASRYNLADGHPRQALTPGQIAAIGDVTSLYIKSAAHNERDAKAAFEHAFFSLAGQESVHRLRPPLSHYSGSSAIEVMANYLRMQKLTVTMAHPTFDSLADTLKRHGVPLTPIPVEEALSLTPSSPPIGTHALYLVMPNNPTGHCPTREQFAGITGFCARHGILLLADFCFRFYGTFWDYDQYQMLTDAGVDFICTEDTGKTWPAGDVKLGMLVTSDRPYGLLKDISDDFLFSVAPFTFEIITRLIGAEHREVRRVLAQDLADVNREVLRMTLDGSPLQIVNPSHRMGLDWLQLPPGWNATALTEWLHAEYGPQLLPGERFYWADHRAGSRYVRVALLRDPGYFDEAATRLRKLADLYQPASVSSLT